MKILTTGLQMMSVFANEDNYPVSTPPAYAKYVADASSWANVDFYSFFKCVQSVAPLVARSPRSQQFAHLARSLCRTSSWLRRARACGVAASAAS